MRYNIRCLETRTQSVLWNLYSIDAHCHCHCHCRRDPRITKDCIELRVIFDMDATVTVVHLQNQQNTIQLCNNWAFTHSMFHLIVLRIHFLTSNLLLSFFFPLFGFSHLHFSLYFFILYVCEIHSLQSSRVEWCFVGFANALLLHPCQIWLPILCNHW